MNVKGQDSSTQKAIICCSLILLTAISITTKRTKPIRPPKGKPGDVQLQQSVLNQVRQGKDYYPAMEKGLREGDYAVRPFWNFRLPTLIKFLALFASNLVPRLILMLLTLITVMLWLKLLLEKGGWLSLIIGVFTLSFVMRCVVSPDAALAYDLWCGILIALSLVVYAKNQTIAIIIGAISLSLRIHCVAFACTMAGFALWEKRYREFLSWIVVIIIFSVYVGFHAHFASQYATDMDEIKRWDSFGGWSFVMATTGAVISDFPKATVLLGPLLPLSLYSLILLNLRASVVALAFICAFLLMGNPSNDYWGLFYAPLYAVGLAYSPKFIRDLLQRRESTASN